MKMKGSKISGKNRTKLGFPTIILLCLFFFLGGLFGSSLLPQQIPSNSLEENKIEFEAIPHGQTGEGSVDMMPFQILSWNPRVLHFPKFATEEQCQAITEMAKPHLKPSMSRKFGGLRTSDGMTISASEDKTGVLDQIEVKIAKATRIPQSHGEPFYLLRYEIGEFCQAHYDTLDPYRLALEKSERIATFFLYLSDVEAGGEEVFVSEDGEIYVYDNETCSGLKVKPRKGDGLLLYSTFQNGTWDEAIHGTCSVNKGQSWVAMKYIRDQVWSESLSMLEETDYAYRLD